MYPDFADTLIWKVSKCFSDDWEALLQQVNRYEWCGWTRAYIRGYQPGVQYPWGRFAYLIYCTAAIYQLL